jgi:DNA-binding transcriptional MerR regulator
MKKEGLKKDFTVTSNEVCELLGISKRSLSRYIKIGILKPEKIKGKRGTLEHRFSKSDLEKFKKPGRTEKTEKARPDNELIALLKEEIKDKKAKIKEKNEQIKQLMERDRERNIVLNNLQNQLLLTEGKKEERKDKEAKDDKKGQGIYGFFKKLFKW